MPTKMFTYNGRRLTTWNLFTGCGFNCSYCWARKLAETRLKRSYPDGFIPTTHPDRFNKRFKPDDFCFIISMGDLSFAPPPVRQAIVDKARRYPDTRFLLCSKDPQKAFRGRPDVCEANIWLGTTLETNRDYDISQAPCPEHRFIALYETIHDHKFISIEPLMDFDSNIFINWLEALKPEIVEVGADNYRNNLPEPTPDKVSWLVSRLKEICPTVILKDGLTRLL